MTDLNLSTEPVPQTQAPPPSKWPLWLVVALALLLLAVLAWLAPAYKKVVSDNETLSKTNQDLRQKLDASSKTKVNSRTFYPNGRIASETSSETDTDTREVMDSRTSDSVDARSHKETVTKRGLFTGMIYADQDKELAFSGTYQALGPISVGGCFAASKAYLGIGLSF